MLSDDFIHASFSFVFLKDPGGVVDQQSDSGIVSRLRLITIPKYRSMITLQIKVRYLLNETDSNELHEFTTALHLTSAHVAGIRVEEEDEEYRGVTIDLNNTQPHAVGLFTNRTFGDQTFRVQNIRSIVSEAFQHGTLQILVKGGQPVNNSIMRVYDLLVAERSKNIFAPWYPKHPDHVYLEHGDYPSPERRPFISMPAKSTFADMNEYVTIIGYARIGEHEHEAKAAETLEKTSVRLRCMTIPKAGIRRYFGFLDMPLGLVRVKPGDAMEVRFWDSAREMYIGWDAQVTMPMPHSPQGAVSIILTRPYDTEKKEVIMTEEIRAINLEDVKNPQDIRKALGNARARYVRIKIHVSDLPLTRQLDSLRFITDRSNRNPHLVQLLTANNFSTLPARDIYRGSKINNEDVCKAGVFNKEQRQALDQLRRVPGGVAVIQGPPGTGKTHFLLHTLLAPVATDGKQVMITSSSNDFVDAVAVQAEQLICKNELSGKYVIRLHTIATEEKIAKYPAKSARPNTKPEILEQTSLDPVIAELDMIKAAMEFYHEMTDEPHGISDRRVKHLKLSLGYRMLQFARVLDPEIPGVDSDRYCSFVIYFQKYREGKLSTENKESFNAEIRRLRDDVLKKASIIVCTTFTTGATCVREHTCPSIIAIDEASKVMEPEVWPVLAWYKPNVFLFLGDQKQLQPTVMGPASGNPFQEQLQLSFFARMHRAGLMDIMFREQHRMCPAISKIVSKVFYNNQLRDSQSVLSRSLSHTLARWNGSKFNVASPLVFLDNSSGDVEKDPSGSSYNESNMKVVCALVEDLLDDRIVSATDIVILTPYQAQWSRYMQHIRRLQKENEAFKGVSAHKIDGFQGGESSIVILDLVAIDRCGFLREPNRLNVGLSRAKFGMFVLGSRKLALSRGAGNYIPSVIRQLEDHCCRERFTRVLLPEYLKRSAHWDSYS